MSIGSPSPRYAGKLVYDNDDSDTGDFDDDIKAFEGDESRSPTESESMYVKLFQEMLHVVLETEQYLFNLEELLCFANYANLSYPARYLFIRLCLRKPDQWLKLADLRYEKELGGNILPAMRELCNIYPSPTSSQSAEAIVKVKEEPREDIIDLTKEEDTEPHLSKIKRERIAMKTVPVGIDGQPDYGVLAEDESRASLRELLECLKTDELRDIVKRMHVQKKDNKRDALVNALLSTTSGQATLPFPVVSSSKRKQADKKKLVQTSLAAYIPQQRGKTQQDRLRVIVTEKLGACIKLNPDVVKLFRRVNLVYFRSTQYTPTMLTQAILARCKKRNFAEVSYERTATIWQSREDLLRYEAALAMEAQIDEIWGGGSATTARARSRSAASKTPAPSAKSAKALSASPSKRRKEDGAMAPDFATQADELGLLEDSIYGDFEHERPRTRDARDVKAVFEKVYPEWQDLVAVKGEESARGKGLERFHYGHVLTRIVCKGVEALGILKEHERELDIIEELLAQRRWRRARRGRWHERRALILMTHFPKEKATYERAHEAVMEALRDNDTHIIYRPKLLRRLMTLEKKLNLAEGERVQCAARSQQAEEVWIEGVRLYTVVDLTGKLSVTNPGESKKAGNAAISPTQSRLPSSLPTNVASGSNVKLPWTGKSIWQGRDEEVNVETLALEHYEELGYKGYHCEGRIVTTLFGLLFWDVIFAPVPGAFETVYQAAPLDIAEETFYTARQDLVLARLEEIIDGNAADILKETYDKYGPDKTACVGVRWDIFEEQDLLDLVHCLSPEGLAAICQVLAEDYANRTAGVPDLIIWNRELSTCKFVEVKGPGDNLQENQKVWIAVLLQAGVNVEVCHVLEQGNDPPKRKTKKKAAASPRKRKREPSEDFLPESETEEPNYSQLDPTPQRAVLIEVPSSPPPSQKDEPSTPSLSPRKKRTRRSENEEP